MGSYEPENSIFTFGRSPPFPSIYQANKNPVTVDVLETGWIVSFLSTYFCFLLLLPATVGKEKAIYFLRVTLTLFVGLVVMLCNFGQEWEIGEITSAMFYKAGSSSEINGTVGIKLGLRSVNITLYADSALLEEELKGETINYNERFYWTWDQGRAGFGPYAGEIQREFRAAQIKGVPYPILWVAEYFTFDGEGLRFGRHYRYAGWYAHICVWAALPAWILTVCLFKLVIKYGAIMLSILGGLLMSASFIWCSVRNFTELAIIFNDDNELGILRTQYGIHWYLALIVGSFCFVCGIIVYLCDDIFHDGLSTFFGVNPYGIIDENYGEDDSKMMEDSPNQLEMQETGSPKKGHQKTIVYKARGTTKLWKKSSMIKKKQSKIVHPRQPINVNPGPSDGEYAYQDIGEEYADGQSVFPTQPQNEQGVPQNEQGLPYPPYQYPGQGDHYYPNQNMADMSDPYYYEDANYAGEYDYSQYYTEGQSQEDWQYSNPAHQYYDDPEQVTVGHQAMGQQPIRQQQPIGQQPMGQQPMGQRTTAKHHF